MKNEEQKLEILMRLFTEHHINLEEMVILNTTQKIFTNDEHTHYVVPMDKHHPCIDTTMPH